MGGRILKKNKKTPSEPTPAPAEPTLARRSMNRKSTLRSGRTIGEARERLQTRNERNKARKKDKQKQAFRFSFTTIAFAALGVVLIILAINFLSSRSSDSINEVIETEAAFEPTIEITDEDAHATSGKITSRMRTYIGQLEHDFRDLGYTPIKAVIPTGSVREVDFYLDGHTGFIKTTIDRGSAVSAEDADRLIRYLANQGINDFQYLDVRISGRAFWK